MRKSESCVLSKHRARELTERRYPDEVVITDVPAGTPGEDGSTPAREEEDDFFSSWDKPAIKRPSNPPSRVGTPSQTSRSASPFLTPGANSNGSRPKSPLSASEKQEPSPPAAVRTGSAVRKTTTASGAKKGSILSSKKTQKLGARKVGSGEGIDFEEAERKAKEEAERIERLGYDPNAEEAESASKESTAATKIASPTPLSPSRPGFGATSSSSHERKSSDVDKVGKGIERLGFGQISKAPAPKKPGFGATGPARSAVDGT